MRLPSANTLQRQLGIDRPLALKLRRILDGRLDPLTVLGTSSATMYLKERDAKLEACNVLLEGHGIEAIRGEWQNGYWCDIKCVYINQGDTYAATILYDRDHGWQVTSYGDWIEALERKGESVL